MTKILLAMKNTPPMAEILAGIGILGGFVSSLFGGWSGSLNTLLIFMGIDYITGLVTAGVFHASKKSSDGNLESRAGWKGLVRKCMTLLMVLIGARLDLLIGTTFIRDGVVIAFLANELLSITENLGLMGVPIPDQIIRSVEVLKRRGAADAEMLSSTGKSGTEVSGGWTDTDAHFQSQQEEESGGN